jgi:hypothetical protein
MRHSCDSFLLTDNIIVQFGAWVAGKTAGGQISHPTFQLNPQYSFSNPGNSQLINTPVTSTLLSSQGKTPNPCWWAFCSTTRNPNCPLAIGYSQ